MIMKLGCGAACDVPEGRDAEVDGGGPAAHLVELGEFLPGCGQADLESFGFVGPAFAFGMLASRA